MDIRALVTYTKLRQIGAGAGMNSEVFLVSDPQRGEEVVAKEIDRPNLIIGLDELFKEARIICASSAPNVVPIYYGCRTADKVCIVMPFYKNGSLADRIQSGPVNVKEVIRIGQQMLNGLARIHTGNHIHFDVKPTNLFFDDNDNVMVADFGQTRKIDASGVAQVPPMYPFALPPEFYTKGVATIHSDIYHAGLSLYRAANGDPIFNAQKPSTRTELEQKTISGKFPDRNRFMPHIPSLMRTVIRKALKLDPADRYHSASAMAQALANVPVRNNWSVVISGNMAIWRALRTGQGDLVVEATEQSGKIDIRIYTERAGHQRRAKDKTKWRTGLDAKVADKHLTDLFDEWEHA